MDLAPKIPLQQREMKEHSSFLGCGVTFSGQAVGIAGVL